MTANLAATFKAEILRLARKEVRTQTADLRKALGGLRTEVSLLKKALKDAQRAATQKRRIAAPLAQKAGPGDTEKLRFRADGYKTLRARLGLSATDMGLLTGVSGQTVYSREQGAKPRSKAELVAIANLRTMPKAQVHEMLDQLRRPKVNA